MTTVVPAYIAIQAFITALGVGVIRYGEMSKGLIFVGPFVGISVGVFFGAKLFASFMLPV